MGAMGLASVPALCLLSQGLVWKERSQGRGSSAPSVLGIVPQKHFQGEHCHVVASAAPLCSEICWA